MENLDEEVLRERLVRRAGSPPCRERERRLRRYGLQSGDLEFLGKIADSWTRPSNFYVAPSRENQTARG